MAFPTKSWELLFGKRPNEIACYFRYVIHEEERKRSEDADNEEPGTHGLEEKWNWRAKLRMRVYVRVCVCVHVCVCVRACFGRKAKGDGGVGIRQQRRRIQLIRTGPTEGILTRCQWGHGFVGSLAGELAPPTPTKKKHTYIHITHFFKTYYSDSRTSKIWVDR